MDIPRTGSISREMLDSQSALTLLLLPMLFVAFTRDSDPESGCILQSRGVELRKFADELTQPVVRLSL